MYKVTRVVHYRDDIAPADRAGLDDRVRQAAAATHPDRTLIAPTLPGVINGGDLIVHLQFADRDTWLQVREDFDRVLGELPTTRLDGAEYSPGRGGRREDDGAQVYRTLLLRAEDAPAEISEQFAADTLSMPRYVSSMLSWQLSPIDRSLGPTTWTHVWEQEYRDLPGLLGEYMLHPVHWAVVDRWFDPEFPDYVVRTKICHTFCDSDGRPVLYAQ